MVMWSISMSIPRRRVALQITRCVDCPKCEGLPAANILISFWCMASNKPFLLRDPHKEDFIPEDCPL